jgi:yeast amino acid transporter
MVIAYVLVCGAVWAALQTLGEITIAFPTPGNFIDYADRWVDPCVAFGAGLSTWIGLILRTLADSSLSANGYLAWTAIIALEAIFFDIFLQYWAEGAVPLPASSKCPNVDYPAQTDRLD